MSEDMERTEDVRFILNWFCPNMLFKDIFWFCAGLGNAPAARQQNGSRL